MIGRKKQAVANRSYPIKSSAPYTILYKKKQKHKLVFGTITLLSESCFNLCEHINLNF